MTSLTLPSTIAASWRPASSLCACVSLCALPLPPTLTVMLIWLLTPPLLPPRLLRTNYSSPLSGKADVPENYAEVTYALMPEGNGTKITVTLKGFPKIYNGVIDVSTTWLE